MNLMDNGSNFAGNFERIMGQQNKMITVKAVQQIPLVIDTFCNCDFSVFPPAGFYFTSQVNIFLSSIKPSSLSPISTFPTPAGVPV